jgi:fructose-bisphosphate aldolase class I
VLLALVAHPITSLPLVPTMSDFPVPFLPAHKYHDELIATARAIAQPGKGILAADESLGTIGKRFVNINVENTHENRLAYRKLLFTTPNLKKNISGVITFEETLFDIDPETKKPLIQPLLDAGIVVGIKNDKGTRLLPGTDGEKYTQGLTDLDVRNAKYYKAGARFCKWRAVVKISRNTPSPQAIHETAFTLARYAAISQAAGLVPIVEPEVLMDGDHSLEVCAYWTEKVIAACYSELNKQNVLLEGTILKPNMVLPGADCKNQRSPEECGRATVVALQRTVPPAVPGITFLSGGQSEKQATANLNAMNAGDFGPRPWSLTFSFGRALQGTVLKVWSGKQANVAAAQKTLLEVAKANGDANLGKSNIAAMSDTTLYQKNYTY